MMLPRSVGVFALLRHRRCVLQSTHPSFELFSLQLPGCVQHSAAEFRRGLRKRLKTHLFNRSFLQSVSLVVPVG